MTTIIANATIVTGNQSRDVLHQSAIAISEDRIVSVGPTAEIEQAHPDAEVVDGRGKAVFPGLVNCHTHLLATGDRGILEDFGFPTRLTFPVSARSLLSDEERRVLALLGVLESVRSGATCLLEISNNMSPATPPTWRPPGCGWRWRRTSTTSTSPKSGTAYSGSKRPGPTPAFSVAPTSWSPGTAGNRDGSGASSRPTRPRPARLTFCAAAGRWPNATASDIPSTCPRAARRSKR